MSFFRRGRVEDYVAQAINDFQSETAEITGAPEPFALRSTLYILTGMVVAAVLLMSIGEVERVVVASGRVVSEDATLVVQPLETAVVRSMLVSPGERVKKGDVLATLDPTFSAADRAALQKEEERLRAEIARLDAERDGREFVPIEDTPYFQLQRAIWQSRQAQYRSTISKFQQLIESAHITIERATADVEHFRARLKLASNVEDMRKELERIQVGSRLNSLIATDGRVAMARNLTDAQSTIRSAKSDLEVQLSEREVFVQKWNGDVIRDLLDRRAEYEQIKERLIKAQRRWEAVELRAVKDAVVLDVSNFSVGSVVQAGERLITLVPTGGRIYVEADIDAADQGFIAPGQDVRVKFSAYPFIKHGMAYGVLRTVSADSFSRDDDQRDIAKGRLPERFYRARIDMTEIALHDVPDDFELVPGMPLYVDIVVGEHTILSYLMEGAMRTTAEGLREP
jgi:HlyD family type I secretion membrane fusion protein